MKTRFLGKVCLLAFVINFAIVLGNPSNTLADPQQPAAKDAPQQEKGKTRIHKASP